MTTVRSSALQVTHAGVGPAADEHGAWKRWLRRLPAGTAPRHVGRALLISYTFPPTGGSGVQRAAKLAKYLPNCGWSVDVLAADHDRFPWIDESLLEDVPVHTGVHRIAGYEPACVAERIASFVSSVTGTESRSDEPGGLDRHGRRSSRRIEDALHWRLTRWAGRLGLGDGHRLWVGSAARAAVQLHETKPFDAVISTGPPHFAHEVALRFARKTRVPWIADLRDPLVSDFDRQSSSAWQRARMSRIEFEVLHRADAVVATCPSYAWDLQDRYPHRSERIRAITNGFDRDDLIRAVDDHATASTTDDICEIVAAGAFYGRRELAHIVRPLERLLATQPAWRGRVRLAIAGTLDRQQHDYWTRHRPSWLRLLGYVDHDEALRLTARAACCLVVQPACDHGQLSIPGKTFELLALPTHVLGLVPPHSDTGQIIARAGASTVAPLENANAVAAALQSIIEACFAGRLERHRDWRRIDHFDRRSVACRFAECLNAITSSRARHESSAPPVHRATEVA